MARKQKILIIRIVLAAVLLAAAAFLPELDGADLSLENLSGIIGVVGGIKGLLSVISYLVIGYDIILNAFRGLRRANVFDEMFLMTAATFGALFLREFPEAAAVMLFYQIGEFFQELALGKSRKSIQALFEIRPDYAVVIREGEEQRLDPEEVEIGEIIVVRPGERVPLDGIIVEGRSSVDASSLTGESLPIFLEEGDRVLSSNINLNGLIKIKVEKTFEESTVSKVLELVENSAAKKAKLEKFISRFARYYTPIVVSSAVFLAILPPLVLQSDFALWLKRALVFLMLSCPCALVVSVPMSFFAGIGKSSRSGILIKGSNYMESLASVKNIVFDKTGTLTNGNFEVDGVFSSELGEEEFIEIAAHIEAYSSHPIARSILTKYGKTPDYKRIEDVEEIAGRGAKAKIDGKLYYIGNSRFMAERRIGVDGGDEAEFSVHLASEEKYLGYITISDKIRSEADDVMAELRRNGINPHMLTGDSKNAALKVAEKLGIESCYSELLPQDKVTKLEEIQERDGLTGFVGDGINDAPVLARSDVGIAMGGLGSDAAIESADIVLMDDNLQSLTKAIKISKRTISVVKQNIVLAIGVKAVILIFSVFSIANMWLAVFGDVGVMMICILNSLKLFRD